MKKKIVTLSILIVISGIVIFNIYNKNSNEVSLGVNNNKSNLISMMIETGEGTGKYEISSSDSFPIDGYIFNESLSGCENGSKLEWNNDTNNVVLKGNISDKCYAYFDVYTLAKVKSMVVDVTGTKLDLSVDAEDGTAKVSKYFFSIDDGDNYKESNINTYTFTNLSKGTYTVKTYVEDTNGKKSKSVDDSAEIIGPTLAQYVVSQYTGTQGANGLYYHNSSLANGAGDNSYRYAGANPNNYVCFGSEDATCPSNNLYRIIGVFDENNHGVTGKQLVKLTKASILGSGNWSSTDSTWKDSNAYNFLNTQFPAYYISNYVDKVQSVNWKVSNMNVSYYPNFVGTPKSTYDSEITNAPTTFNAKYGLMYISDYGFASTSTYWTTDLINYSDAACNYNFLYMKSYTQWTISKDDAGGYAIHKDGYLSNSVSLTNTFTYTPVFYLIEKVIYLSGTGTSSDPIRIS